MERKGRPSRKEVRQGSNLLDAISGKAVGTELCEALENVEHRIEVLTSISREQEISGHYELAQAYSNNAAEARAYAQLIRRLLDLGRGGNE